ncbi:hypothetical protein SAMN05518800_1866 [Variovorax sp. YR752]|uniref:hypothetical protein n=1 Tax=Variovorax sp. YR752 TaxID=1884383 RepID=UPI000BD78F7D|nr:hypothetical protein [Variovorax sp. YR752]SOD25353.1 hypothetical protein SAMN05518800_1866 [Variovorax sp. YR752]
MKSTLATRVPFRFIVVLVCASILAACSSTPPTPYMLPDGLPSANLRSGLIGAFGHYESISVSISGRPERQIGHGQLFTVRKSKSKPEGYIKVAANEELIIGYSEAVAGGGRCGLAITAVLEAGKNYSLVGGFAYEEGPIPILLGTRKCQLGIVDDATRLPIPVRYGK